MHGVVAYPGGSRYYQPEQDLLRFGAFLLVFMSHVVPGDVAFYAQMHTYPHSVAGQLWSVSIEEQFYLAWPLILRRWAWDAGW